MQTVLAFVIGSLYAGGIYMILRRNLVKLILGLAMLSHAANLLIFTTVGLVRGRPPLVAKGALRLEEPPADPLAQALVLTAIVISFGLLAFTVTLLYRTYQATGTDDIEKLRASEP